MTEMSSEDEVINVENALKRLRLDNGDTKPQDLETAVSILAASSRTSSDVRIQLADPAILRKLREVVECGLSDSIETTSLALRCLGNACIDNDDARTAVAATGFSWAQCCFHAGDEELKWLTVKVLYNICSDHDAAQLQCAMDHVHYDLIRLCLPPTTQQNVDLSLCLDLLLWITSQLGHEPERAREPLPDDLLADALTLPHIYCDKVPVEEIATLFQVLLDLMRFPAAQTKIIASHKVAEVWQSIELVDVKLNQNHSADVSTDAEELLRPLASSMLWCLSDIAAHPAFPREYGLSDPFVKHLLQTLTQEHPKNGSVGSRVDQMKDMEHGDITVHPTAVSWASFGKIRLTAASQMIGNLIWKLPASDITPLVTEERLHAPLWLTLCELASSSSEELLHSIAGLLLQLTRGGPEVCEAMMDGNSAVTGLSALCQSNSPRLKHDGRTLLRAMCQKSKWVAERLEHLVATLNEGRTSVSDTT